MAVAAPGFVIERVDHWLVLSFTQDRLTDEAEIQETCDEIQDELRRLPMRGQVVLDFRRVDRVSSHFIGQLLGIKRAVDQKYGTLVLTRVGPELRDVLELTRLSTQFTIAERLRDVVSRSKPRTIAADRSPVRRPADETLWIDSVN